MPSEARTSVTAIVCGSRTGAPSGVPLGWVRCALDAWEREHARVWHVLNGGAPGIDALAAEWARERRRPCTTFPARWEEHKRAAGPLRNAAMLAYLRSTTEAAARVVLAFPGGTGTACMVTRAHAANVPVWRCVLVGRVGYAWHPSEVAP